MKTTFNLLATMMFLIASVGFSSANEFTLENLDQEIEIQQERIPFLISVSVLSSDAKGHYAIVHHPYSDNLRIYNTRRYQVKWYIENGKLFSNDVVVRLGHGQFMTVSVLDTHSGHTATTTITTPGNPEMVR